MTHQLEARKYDSILRDLDGISAWTMTEHYKLYQGYVNKYNEIMGKIEAVDRAPANQIFSDIRSLKVDLTFAVGDSAAAREGLRVGGSPAERPEGQRDGIARLGLDGLGPGLELPV